MKNIADEIRVFLQAMEIRQSQLAKESGVSTATISRLCTGRQKDITERRAVAIRAAMERLASSRGSLLLQTYFSSSKFVIPEKPPSGTG